MPTVAETRFDMVQLVFPEHANVRGTLYGGRMMSWIVTAGTLAATRLSRGAVVLGAMDEVDFLTPVRIGDIVRLTSQVELVGRSSMEVGVAVEAEHPATGSRRLTTSSHLAFVAVDGEGRPRPVCAQIVPADPAEAGVVEAARVRRGERMARIAARGPDVSPGPYRHGLEEARLVFPEDAVQGTLMFAGRLLMQIDEIASIVALRYCRCPVVTASTDALTFYEPIRVGDILVFQAALNYVGRSSMEIGVRIVAEHPLEGTVRHSSTVYQTMVSVGENGRPAAVPPYVPEGDDERRRFADGERRRAARQARVARVLRAGPS